MQVAAICLRGKPGREEVLLVSSLDTGRLVVPKGWPMRGRSLAQAALQEAWEEAGVRGAVGAEPMGQFHYAKRRRSGFAQTVEVRCYLVRVSALDEAYPEAGRRKRVWLAPKEAARQVREKELRTILLRLPH